MIYFITTHLSLGETTFTHCSKLVRSFSIPTRDSGYAFIYTRFQHIIHYQKGIMRNVSRSQTQRLTPKC